jgi:hypothetical protein
MSRGFSTPPVLPSFPTLSSFVCYCLRVNSEYSAVVSQMETLQAPRLQGELWVTLGSRPSGGVLVWKHKSVKTRAFVLTRPVELLTSGLRVIRPEWLSRARHSSTLLA